MSEAGRPTWSANSATAPPLVPDHTLLRPIGRGAYGEVWLACNVMGTPRAVKIVWRKHFDSHRPFEREFAGIRRFEPISRSSGGLVHVLHVGKNDAQEYFYYVMELADDVQGSPPAETQTGPEAGQPRWPDLAPGFQISNSYQPRTLRSDLKRLGRLSTANCLRLAIDVASGLGQLHRHGLVHRDVKPGNIIYVNGRAKLADIGLVTAEGEGRTFVGTEGYVPPEGPGAPASDLYALGIVLYEASTGFSPERLPDVPPEWFSEAAGDAALELHEIILKASEGQRERRYANADEMQADLALLQSGQSVRHVRALQRRYARLRIAGTLGTTLLALAVAAALLANYRARLAAAGRAKEALLRQAAQQSQARAEGAEREAQRQFQAALYEEARALVLTKELGHRAKALDAIRRSAGSTNAAELRRVAFAALSLPDLRLEREFALPGASVAASISPNLERMTLGGGREAVTVYSLPDLKVLATVPPKSGAQAYVVRWSADSRFIAMKRQYDGPGNRADLEVWNVSQNRLLFIAREDIALNSFDFHPRQPFLMAGHTGGAVSVWDLESGIEERPFQLPDTPHTLAYSPEGDRVAASYRRGSNWVVGFHDARSGSLTGAAECAEPVASVAWHPRAEWVSIIGEDETEWNCGVWLIAPEGGPKTLLGRHKIKTSGVSFSPDGNYLISCGWERELICWDLRTHQRAFTCADAGYSLAWGLDGVRCAMFPRAKPSLQFYVFEPPACLELSGNSGERLRPGAFSPDGRWLALPDSENLCVWAVASGSAPALLAGRRLGPVFFSTNGSQLFASDGLFGAAKLKAWHLASTPNPAGTPQLTPLPVAEQPGLYWAGLAGDDLVLSSAEGLRLVARTNLGSGKGRALKIPAELANASPDGRWLAITYSYSPLVTVHGLPAVEELARLHTSGLVGGVWFSPAGDELTVINRGGLEQWDTGSWRLKRRVPGSPVSNAYVLYAPDGRGLWRVTNFRDTAFCAADTLEPLLPLPANVVPMALSSDGCQLAVSVDDQRAQVWDLPKLRAHLRELGLDWQRP